MPDGSREASPKAAAPTIHRGSLFVPPTHPDALGFEELARIRRRAFLRFYLRPGYVLSRFRRREFGQLLRQARILASQALS